MANPIYLLTDFSCCEDFEKYLRDQHHANRTLLDTLTQSMVDGWNGKACNIAILGGNLCLLDEKGNNLAAVPMLVQDDDTITRDPVTGKITCVKVKVMGLDKPVKMWMGSRAEYTALENKSPSDTVYFFTDIDLCDVYNTLKTVSQWIWDVTNGERVVPKANHAIEADHASSADQATNANYANTAAAADKATEADHATSADMATNAGTAAKAMRATNADNATKATNATNAEKATEASHATTADSAEKATNDGNGKKIDETYGNFSGAFVKYAGGSLGTAQRTYQFNVEFDGGGMHSVIVNHKYGKQLHTPLHITRNNRYILTIDTDGTVKVNKYDDTEQIETGHLCTDCEIYYRKIL